ncbi:MAG TPA: VLRF1 family aeRF1-type release factor [Candidatus Dormibacteraeota bacterium]|nr:VLRF1 family aeRF1-type release factor [Candidatus Dormibacteraeota bacterium]
MAELEAKLAQVSTPLLTLYFEANAKGSVSRSSTVNSLPWLRKEAKRLAAGLRPVERAAFQEQLDRVETFLRNATTGNGALAIFAGSGGSIYVPLPFAISNELHWGEPALTQLLQIAEEHKTACVVAVDRTGARFFRYELGELAELPAMKFEIDVSEWKKKDHSHMAQRDTKMPHGMLRDAFKQRMDQQYLRFFRHVSERIKFIRAKESLDVVLLVGSDRLTKPIASALPPEVQERTLALGEDLAKVAAAKLQARIEPKLDGWIKQFAAQQTDRLLEGGPTAIVGLDETMAQLQDGRLGSILMVRGLDAALRQCVNCGDINRSADPSCANCGGARREVMLSEILDKVAEEHYTKIEILDPDAAKRLAKAGGIGGWLRQPSLVAAR